MSNSDLRDRMDGLELDIHTKMEADFRPEALSRHNRTSPLDCAPAMYKRTVKKKVDRKGGRFRTQPVTFSEIKEVDEDKVEDPLFVLSNNSSDYSDNEKSRSEIDIKGRVQDLTRSLSLRRQRAGSRSKLDPPSLDPESPGEEEESRDIVDLDRLDIGSLKIPVKYPKGFVASKSRPSI